MDNEKVTPILNGYDELGELIELAVRLKKVSEQITWYLGHIEQRITAIMQPARTPLKLVEPTHDNTQNNAWNVGSTPAPVIRRIK